MTSSNPSDLRDALKAFKKRGEEYKEYREKFQDFRGLLGCGELEKDEILTILYQYNNIWSFRVPSFYEKDTIEGPLFVGDEVPQVVSENLNQGFLYRMNFIKQLSTTAFRKNIGGSHTRLSHSQGVAATANRYITHLENDCNEDITRNEKRAVYLYAFLHDAFHGPFGHSLDLVKSLFPIQKKRRKLDKNMLLDQISREESEVHKVLNDLFCLEDRDEVKDHLYFLIDPQDGDYLSNHRDKYYLVDIIESAVDADRLDYLPRDCLHLNESLGLETEELIELVESSKIKEVTEDGEQLRRLCYPISEKDKIEQLLAKRRELYTKIFHSPEKIAADEMLCHAIYHFIDHFNIDPRLGDTEKEIMNELVKLTDQGLLRFLLNFGEPFYARELSRQLFTNLHYVDIKDYRLEHETAENAEEQLIQRMANDERVTSLSRPDGLDLEDARRIKEHVSEANMAFSNLLFHMALGFSGRFHAKVNLEQELWNRLMSKGMDEKFREMRLEQYGQLDEGRDNNNQADTNDGDSNYSDLINYPHIYISFPPHLNIKQSTFEHFLTEGGGEDILWCGDDQSVSLELPLGESYRTHNVVLCGPEPFDEEPSRKTIDETFRNMVKDIDAWIAPEILDGP